MRVYEFLSPGFITVSLERKATPPWGLRGDEDGAVNGVEVTSPDGSVHHARRATQHPIAAREKARIMTGGGGGYGPPGERDREAVLRDVAEGHVSAEAAPPTLVSTSPPRVTARAWTRRRSSRARRPSTG